MSNYEYTTFSSCSTCAQNGTQPKFIHELQLFPESCQLEFIEIDIFGPLPHTVNGNQFAIVMTDRYSKDTRAMLAWKDIALTSSERVLPFLDSPLRHPCIRPCGR